MATRNQIKELPPREVIKFFLNYDPATGIFHWLRGNRKGRAAGNKSNSWGHLRVTIAGVDYALHRLAWAVMSDEPVPDVIDHINRKPSDNSWSNLQASTHLLNAMNKSNKALATNNTSGYRGVYFDKRGYFNAILCYRRNTYFIGCFRTPELASAAYEAARQEKVKDSLHDTQETPRQ